MKKSFRKSAFKFIVGSLAALLLLIVAIIGFVYTKQDEIVASQLNAVNLQFMGKIEVGDSHLALFQNFPYISIKIDDVRVLETKETDAPAIVNVADIYIGFAFFDIIRGGITTSNRY